MKINERNWKKSGQVNSARLGERFDQKAIKKFNYVVVINFSSPMIKILIGLFIVKLAVRSLLFSEAINCGNLN